MDLKIIQEFVVLSETLNFSRAADQLFTTQATLSRHIMRLEEELGKPLLERSSRKVELTKFGAGFLPYAKRIVQTMEECNAYLLEENGARRKSIVIGACVAILQDQEIKVSAVLSEFCKRNPTYNLTVVEEKDDSLLVEKLRRKECEIILLREPLEISDSFAHFSVAQPEAMSVLLPKTHPFANAESVMLDCLKEEVFLTPPIYSNTYQMFVARCRQIGFEPQIRPYAYGKAFAVNMMKNGLGIPVVSHVKHNEGIEQDVDFSIVKIYPPINQVLSLVCPDLPRVLTIAEELLKAFQDIVPK